MSGDRGSEAWKRLEEENLALRGEVERLEGTRRALEKLSERILQIDSIGQEFNCLDLDRIVGVATRRIPEVIGAKACSLFLYDYDANELRLKSHTHSHEIAPRVSITDRRNTVMEMALYRQQILNISSFNEFEKTHKTRLERPFAERYASEACLSVPLQTANYVVGILNFADKRDAGTFDDLNDLPAVEHLSRVLSMAIRNCNLFREVQNQAHTDGLTGLRNYRAFQDLLRAEMHRASRYGRPLGLIMLDVDSFKEINDTYGHPAGDRVLADLGQIILGTVRREDLAARYGGDEIAILLPETAPPGCIIAVERLIEGIRRHEFVHEGRRLPVTISAGLAYHAPEQPAHRLVAAADEALYRAKQAGKNGYRVSG